MGFIHIPTLGVDDWKRFLADPEKQWKAGYSAMELAHSWERGDSFPDEIKAVIETEPLFSGIEPLFAIPEFQVPLPGGSRPSQNDLFLLARCDSGPVVIMIEGKASESFGPTLKEWNASSSRGKTVRLDFLQRTLGLKGPLPGEIRYQLLHRTASPILTATRFHAVAAVMLVHSFSTTGEGFDDYTAFLNLYGVQAKMGRLQEIKIDSPLRTFCGWAKGNPVA